MKKKPRFGGLIIFALIFIACMGVAFKYDLAKAYYEKQPLEYFVDEYGHKRMNKKVYVNPLTPEEIDKQALIVSQNAATWFSPKQKHSIDVLRGQIQESAYMFFPASERPEIYWDIGARGNGLYEKGPAGQIFVEGIGMGDVSFPGSIVGLGNAFTVNGRYTWEEDGCLISELRNIKQVVEVYTGDFRDGQNYAAEFSAYVDKKIQELGIVPKTDTGVIVNTDKEFGYCGRHHRSISYADEETGQLYKMLFISGSYVEMQDATSSYIYVSRFSYPQETVDGFALKTLKAMFVWDKISDDAY